MENFQIFSRNCPIFLPKHLAKMGEFPKSQNFFRKNSSSQNFCLQDFFRQNCGSKNFFRIFFEMFFLETISVSKIFVKNIPEAKIIVIKIFGGKIF